MGIGLVLVVDPAEAEPVIGALNQDGCETSLIGTAVAGEREVKFV